MNDELSAAIDSLAAAKAEHGQLIQTIAADAGMDPATRAELMAHINEEETEKLARIQAAAASVEAPPPPPAAAPTAAPARPGLGLTVGSLRPTSVPPAAGRFTVGSLRPR